MNVDKYAKAIAGGVAAGFAVFTSAQESGADIGKALILGAVAMVVVGVVAWGVPNSVATELETIAADVSKSTTSG